MNTDYPLRELLQELHAAENARQGVPRDTPAYAEAADRVDRLVRAVWEAAGEDPRPRSLDDLDPRAERVMDL